MKYHDGTQTMTVTVIGTLGTSSKSWSQGKSETWRLYALSMSYNTTDRTPYYQINVNHTTHATYHSTTPTGPTIDHKDNHFTIGYGLTGAGLTK
jgi:hypothetical protein